MIRVLPFCIVLLWELLQVRLTHGLLVQASADGAGKNAPHLSQPLTSREQPRTKACNGNDTVHVLEKVAERLEVGMGYVQHRAARCKSRSEGCQKSVAVCVTGQLSRLETRSKMDNLFQSGALQETYTGGVDVFVVADTDSDFYVNNNTIATTDNACHVDFHSPSEVEALFSPFYTAGLYLKQSNSSHKLTPNISNWEKYGSTKPEVDKTTRLGSHFIQWTHLSRCAELIKEQEMATGCQYTTVMKIRDNGIVTKPMDIPVEDTLIVKDCNSWRGVNDKMFIAPRKYLDHALEAPLTFARAVNSGDPWALEYFREVENPEQFLAKTYTRLNVKVSRALNDGTITVVDGRCEGKATDEPRRKWCLVETEKDCHPKGPLDYQTCEFAEENIKPY